MKENEQRRAAAMYPYAQGPLYTVHTPQPLNPTPKACVCVHTEVPQNEDFLFGHFYYKDYNILRSISLGSPYFAKLLYRDSRPYSRRLVSRRTACSPTLPAFDDKARTTLWLLVVFNVESSRNAALQLVPVQPSNGAGNNAGTPRLQLRNISPACNSAYSG